MIGQTINNYVLERKLGEGGMGDVYFARHNRIDRVVAIKVLHKNLFTNENIRTRFKNEANALIKLGHPNIVKIYDYVEQDEFACLIMEYIEGFTLDEYINKVTGPIPGPKATHIIGNVLDAVQYAHDKNIFHRDIKPGNIMVSPDGRTVRIMDFSIAKFADPGNLKTTHANAQLGTPFYMSPEQVKGLAYSALSDIYSLGVTLFEMVTGKCPYQEITNLFELQSKIVNEPLPPTGKYYPNVTGKLQDAIVIATKKEPEQRFKSCNEFKSYLIEEEKVRSVVVPVPIPLTKSNIRKPQPVVVMPEPANLPAFFEEKKRNKRWIYLLGLLAILIIGIFAFKKFNTDEDRDKRGKTGTIDSTMVKGQVDPGNTVGAPDVATKPTSTKDSNTILLPPTPNPDSIINDLVGKKLSTGPIFTEKDKNNITSGKPRFDTSCKCATLTFKDENNKSLYRVTIIYKINETGYVYWGNDCKKIGLINHPPSAIEVLNDLTKEKDEAAKCGLFNQEDKFLSFAPSLNPGGKQWKAKMTFDNDGVKYEVVVTYDITEKGYVYRTISDCKVVKDGLSPGFPTENEKIAALKEKLKRKKKSLGISDADIDELSNPIIGTRIDNDDETITYYIDFEIRGKTNTEKVSFKKVGNRYQSIEN